MKAIVMNEYGGPEVLNTILACRSSRRASSSSARSSANRSSSLAIGIFMASLRLTLTPPSRLAAFRLRA
jgi:hypothetical protein